MVAPLHSSLSKAKKWPTSRTKISSVPLLPSEHQLPGVPQIVSYQLSPGRWPSVGDMWECPVLPDYFCDDLKKGCVRPYKLQFVLDFVRFEKIRGVFEIRLRLPCVFIRGKAFPSDKVFFTRSTRTVVKNCLNFPFKLTINDFRDGCRLNWSTFFVMSQKWGMENIMPS